MSYMRTIPRRLWQSIDLIVIVTVAVLLGWTLLDNPGPTMSDGSHATADEQPHPSLLAAEIEPDVRPAGLSGARHVQQDPPGRQRGPAGRRPARDLSPDIDAPPNGPPNGPGSDGRVRSLSSAQLDEALRIIAELYPERAERYEQLRQRNPEGFERALSQHARGIVGLVWIKERRPELFELKFEELRLERQVTQFAQQLARASSSEREAVLASIRDVVSKQVNLSLRVRAMELLMLESHFQSMREQLQRDSANREQTIASRVQKILRAVGR